MCIILCCCCCLFVSIFFLDYSSKISSHMKWIFIWSYCIWTITEWLTFKNVSMEFIYFLYCFSIDLLVLCQLISWIICECRVKFHDEKVVRVYVHAHTSIHTIHPESHILASSEISVKYIFKFYCFVVSIHRDLMQRLYKCFPYLVFGFFHIHFQKHQNQQKCN